MELRDLEYYLACIDQGSVTAAARHVHAAQPTISHALARLEKQVGERLLERRPRATLRVTPAGELLAVRARAALAALGAFESDLSLLKGRVRGELRIACIQSLNATLLPDVLIAFLKRYPDVRVEARTVAGEDIAQRIAAGHEHVGLVASPIEAEPPRAKGVAYQRLFRERFRVIVPKTHPFAKRRSLPLASLEGERLVLVPEGTFTGAVISRALTHAGVVPHVVMTIASTEALCEAVQRGLGITVLPDSYRVRATYRLCSVPLKEPTPMRDVGLLMPGDEMASPAARAFRALLVEHTRERS